MIQTSMIKTRSLFLASLFMALAMLGATLSPASADEPKAKIAVAYDIGFLGDNSFNDAVNRALLNAKQKYNLVEPFIREVPTNGSTLDRLTRVRFLAQNGYNLVILVGAGYRETVRRVSMEYPNTQFAIINDKTLGQMNISNISYSEEQGAYLAGLIAALNSNRKAIGFIGSEPELLASFTNGAKSISKKVRVVNILYPDEVANLKRGLSQIDVGYATWDGDATVITTVLESYRKKVKLIVERPDQYFADLAVAQGIILATINKNLNKPINQLIAAALQERAIIDILDEKQGIYGREYGLANNGISYTLNGKLSNVNSNKIAAEIKKYLAKIAANKN